MGTWYVIDRLVLQGRIAMADQQYALCLMTLMKALKQCSLVLFLLVSYTGFALLVTS